MHFYLSDKNDLAQSIDAIGRDTGGPLVEAQFAEIFQGILRPMLFQIGQFAGDDMRQSRVDFIGPRLGGIDQFVPAGQRQIIGARNREITALEMQIGKRRSQLLTMPLGWPPWPDAVEEADENRRAAAKLMQGLAIARLDRGRAAEAFDRQMLHEAEEERQILARDALLIERQDKIAACRLQQVIAVFDTFGNSLAG